MKAFIGAGPAGLDCMQIGGSPSKSSIRAKTAIPPQKHISIIISDSCDAVCQTWRIVGKTKPYSGSLIDLGHPLKFDDDRTRWYIDE